MSFLSATLVSAALLGVGPGVANSEHPAIQSPSPVERSVMVVSNQEVELTACQTTANSCGEVSVPCGASGCTIGNQGTTPAHWVAEEGSPGTGCVLVGCETNGGCQTHSGAYSGGHCQHGGGGWCPWGGDDDCEPSCWDRHLFNKCIGPGDFHPHYPYMPVNHGYYYFRPYNFEHVLRDAATAGQMGGDPRAPYSVEFLKGYFPPAPIEEVS
ncbi:MAG: hypothetical protein KDA84_25460, partial [Planctomycetaceae bacterium]|nr:hypothetical protein [Planctomycetaceae bacterium]